MCFSSAISHWLDNISEAKDVSASQRESDSEPELFNVGLLSLQHLLPVPLLSPSLLPQQTRRWHLWTWSKAPRWVQSLGALWDASWCLCWLCMRTDTRSIGALTSTCHHWQHRVGLFLTHVHVRTTYKAVTSSLYQRFIPTARPEYIWTIIILISALFLACSEWTERSLEQQLLVLTFTCSHIGIVLKHQRKQQSCEPERLASSVAGAKSRHQHHAAASAAARLV